MTSRVPRHHFEESVAVKRALGDSLGLALSLAKLGEVIGTQGDLRLAHELLGESSDAAAPDEAVCTAWRRVGANSRSWPRCTAGRSARSNWRAQPPPLREAIGTPAGGRGARGAREPPGGCANQFATRAGRRGVGPRPSDEHGCGRFVFALAVGPEAAG